MEEPQITKPKTPKTHNSLLITTAFATHHVDLAQDPQLHCLFLGETRSWREHVAGPMNRDCYHWGITKLFLPIG